jgi:hypothetical protein
MVVLVVDLERIILGVVGQVILGRVMILDRNIRVHSEIVIRGMLVLSTVLDRGHENG